MSAIYDIAARTFAAGAWDWVHTPWSAFLVTTAYTPDFANHQYVADLAIGSVVSGPIPLIPLMIQQNGFLAAKGVDFPNVTSSLPLAGMIVAEKIVPVLNGRLVGFFDDGYGFGMTPIGEDIFVLQDQINGGLFRL